MKKSDLFKQQRSEKRNRLKELQEAATTENRDYNETEEQEINTLLDEIRSLDAKIKMHEGLEEQARQAAAAAGGAPKGGASDGDKRDFEKFSFVKLMRAAAQNRPLEGIEREMQQEAEKEMREAGQAPNSEALGIPMVLLNSRFAPKANKRDMTVTGGSGGSEGGVTVATEVQGYIEALREHNVLLANGADFLGGLTGNIDMPRENAVFNPVWEGETDEAAEVSPTYTKVQMTPKRLSGVIEMSNQLLIQNSSSIEARVMRQILMGHAIALDKAGFNGSGSGQPTGIINDGDVTVIAIGANGGAITDAQLLALEEAVDLANGSLSGAMYAVTPKIRKVLKTTKLDSGSGLFLWDRITNTVNSYPAVSTNNLPANLSKGTGNNLNAMVFGNFNACAFGQWGGIEILRDPFTKAQNGLVRLVLNAFNDFHVLQPGQLAACKDVDVTA